MKDTIKKNIKKILILIYHGMARVFPLNCKKVIFMSNMGRNYSDNPRAVYEAFEKDARFIGTKPVWVFNGDYLKTVRESRKHQPLKHKERMLPKNCKIVRYGSLRYYFHMATSFVWIFNTRQEPYLVKRNKAMYFMTWHGTPLKKLGLDLENFHMAGEARDIESYKASFTEEAAKWDCLIVQNDFSEKVLPGSLGYKGEVLKTGYPRNDRLVKAFAASRIRDVLSGAGKDGSSDSKDVKDGRKVLLYAPTWRDDEYVSGGFYKGVSGLDFEYLEKELSKNFRIIVKLHYLTDGKAAVPENCIKSGFVKVYGNEADISRLYLQADGLITDYSSVFFDYSILERPIFFFCYDMENYRDRLRGFYLNLEEIAPGPISVNKNELVKDIRNYFGKGREDEIKRVKAFKSVYNKYDDGKASEKVLDVVAEHMRR